MSLGGHLREARNRVGWAALGLIVCFVIGWLAYPFIFDALMVPVREMHGGGAETNLNFTGVLDPFDTKVRTSFFVAVVLSCPWWLAQFWLYVAPGLTRREKWIGLAFVGAGVPLFVGGAALAWNVLPKAVEILSSVTPEGVWNLVSAADYLTFVMQFMFIFGCAFLLPLSMVALTGAGIVRAVTWRRGWRWAVVGISVFAALATPSPDAVSMIFMMIPMVALYGLALLVCAWVDRRRAKAAAAREAEWDAEHDGGASPDGDAAPSSS